MGHPDHPSVEIVEWAKALVAAPIGAEMSGHLVEIVRDPGDSRAEMAAWALGFGELVEESRGAVVKVLCEVVTDVTRSERLRGQAAESIAEQLEFSADEDVRQEASDLLIKMLRDTSATVRFWSAFALGKLGATSAVPVLRQLVADSALAPGWWTVGEEAADAIEVLEGRPPPARSPSVAKTRTEPSIPPD